MSLIYCTDTKQPFSYPRSLRSSTSRQVFDETFIKALGEKYFEKVYVLVPGDTDPECCKLPENCELLLSLLRSERKLPRVRPRYEELDQYLKTLDVKYFVETQIPHTRAFNKWEENIPKGIWINFSYSPQTELQFLIPRYLRLKGGRVWATNQNQVEVWGKKRVWKKFGWLDQEELLNIEPFDGVKTPNDKIIETFQAIPKDRKSSVKRKVRSSQVNHTPTSGKRDNTLLLVETDLINRDGKRGKQKSS